ncbi:signaling lymphocytic activation molecule [Onychostruthus taczanowskii]|uniref:signaling lymphocytic activation molecule n=1 Tax=Onychostruthus taczanowskii TaxID=356909 RepID=UPI001B802881|nr:signaling lymphocytic activation molecule [Onychostruthus taczanowskii]
MGSGAWLQLLLTLGALWGIGAKETVLGILGEATLLRIPRELQERTEQFGEASWKKIIKEPLTKKFLVKISGRNHSEFQPERMRFREQNFSLEILNTSRDDQRLYEYSVNKGSEEEVWQIQLEVFEPVANLSIRILHRESSNGSCSLALNCSSERGDNVSYSWDSRDNGTGGICSGNGSVLRLSFPVRSAAFGCVCTARNPVSSRRAAFDAARCGSEQRGVPRVRTELLVPLVVLGVIVIIVVIVAIVTSRATRSAKRDPDPSQVTPDPSQVTPASATIYAQVQRVQKPKGTVPSATALSCTTIYTAATGPPPAPDGAPRSPAGSPTPRGRPPLSQEPTTVYASVTLPVA